MCSPKRKLGTGDGDQSNAMKISCSKDLHTLSFQYLHIVNGGTSICIYSDSPSVGKLLPEMKLDGRTLPWKHLLADLF